MAVAVFWGGPRAHAHGAFCRTWLDPALRPKMTAGGPEARGGSGCWVL